MSVSYTLRMPDDLKRLVEMEAKNRGVTIASFVVNACWKDLDRSVAGAPPPAAAPVADLIPPTKPDIAALRAICAGKPRLQPPPAPPERASDEPVALCEHKEWAEDGEQYRCRLVSGHKGKCQPGQRVS